MVRDYGLSFISSEDLFLHVKKAIESEPSDKITSSQLENINHFHQSLLKSISNSKFNLSRGLDVINKSKKIYIEVKNTCPDMNTTSARHTYMQMQHEILSDRSATCYLVEIFSKPNQDTLWKIIIDGQELSHKNIRRISIDKFYLQITGIKSAFKELCHVLPRVYEDALTLAESPNS